MGRTYFSHLRGHPRAGVIAVHDRNERRRTGDWTDATGNIARVGGSRIDMSGITPHAEFDSFLADANIDVVAVTLPTPCHADYAVRALNAGKHVICEKPMALRLPDCDRMIAAARDAGRTLMIAQCIRFWPQYETIKSLVDAGRIGRVRFAALRRLASPPMYSTGNWLMDHRQSGGGLFDLHVHDVDFAHHLLGVPQTLHAAGTRGPSGGIDHVAATYRYGDGRYAIVEGGWAFHAPWPFEMAISVVGEAGTLEWSSRRGPDVLLYSGGEKSEPIAVQPGDGWTRELDYFIDCITEHGPVARCAPESSRISIGLTLLEKRSVTSGKSVRVPRCVSAREDCTP